MTQPLAAQVGRYVVMGVSGCGKSTIGSALAQRMGITFLDDDDLHPPVNVEKMRRGDPLDEADRAPWLACIGKRLQPGTVIACSALKRAYRECIRQGAGGPVTFIYLHGDRETLAERLRSRRGHFMPLSLLDSQMTTLEEPADDEPAILAGIEQPTEMIVAQILCCLENQTDERKLPSSS